MSLSKCECGGTIFIPLHGYPQYQPPPTPPKEGHEHSYKPFDPVMEAIKQIGLRLERIEQLLGLVAKGGGSD